jgi:hypothetical protein
MFTLTSFRLGFRLLAGAIAAAFLTLAPVPAGTISPAQAQVSLSVQFRSALEPHGRWERHARWGEVWIPANRPRDWRPYTLGRWVYTDDWGWYWIEDQSEAAWGLVTYHYGRWVYMMTSYTGAGFRARSGVRPGCSGGAERMSSGGRHCLPTR